MTVCNHRKSDSFCPISKTPCIGECIYANILDDISLGIIGLDLKNREVFYQNRSAVDIFKSTIKPRDYKTLIDLLLPKDVDYSRSKTLKLPDVALREQIYRLYGLSYIRHLPLDIYNRHHRKSEA